MAGRLDDLIGIARSPRHFGYYCQRLVQSVETRQKVARFLAKQLPKPRTLAGDAARSLAAQLDRDGIAYLPNLLSAGRLGHQYALANPCYDRIRPENGPIIILDYQPRQLPIPTPADIDPYIKRLHIT